MENPKKGGEPAAIRPNKELTATGRCYWAGIKKI